MFLSVPAALAVGVGPGSLVTGGVVAYGLLVAATFWLNYRAFGPAAATWGLVPLTFASTGMIWLSGRITGGHLAAAAWHAAAFAILAEGWHRGGGWRWWAGLGVWTGLGLYVDSMGLGTVIGLVAAGVIAGWWGAPRPRSARRAAVGMLAFALGVGVGVAPRFVGQRVDPYDCYQGQFATNTQYKHVLDNLWFLLLDCEPRLIAGHRLPGMEIDPTKFPDGTYTELVPSPGWLSPILTGLALLLFAWGLARLIQGKVGGPLRSKGIGWGLVASSLAVVAGFLVMPNIENSDNYRYLVLLLAPWSAGFGVLFARWSAGGRVAQGFALLVGIAFAGMMTVDASRWYGRLGWVEADGWRPRRVEPRDAAFAWLTAHPEVDSILGGYWDAYRFAFLSGGRIRAVPLPEYPNRFPEAAVQPRYLVARPFPGYPHVGYVPIVRARERALALGGREVAVGPDFSIVDLPARRPAP